MAAAGIRAAVDARSLQARPVAGVGRAVDQVVRRLPGLGVDLDLLYDTRLAPVEADDLPGASLRAPLPGGAPWLQLAAPAWLRGYGGLFHCPFYGLPYWQPVPMVVTIHDMTFEDFPQLFTPAARAVFRAQARHAARTARAVITVSEHSRGRIVERYRVPPERVLVAPSAVDAGFRPLDQPEPPSGSERPYLVALGGAARRRVEVAAEAWRIARRACPELELRVIGPAALAGEPGLHLLNTVTTEELVSQLQRATAFCYPTEYEGFGLIALEAMACGAPVVAARVGSLPEVLGEAAVWSDGLDAASFAAALQPLVEGTNFQLERRTAAIARAQAAPTWDNAAAVHVRAYRMTLES